MIRVMGRRNSDIYEIYTRPTQQAAAKMTGVIGSTAFHDMERGKFHSERPIGRACRFLLRPLPLKRPLGQGYP